MPERQPPAVPSWALPRPRLIGAIDAAANPLIVIRAGAGYGKTMLASQWAKSRSGARWWDLTSGGSSLEQWKGPECDLVVDGYRPGDDALDSFLLSLLEKWPAERRLLLLSRAEPTLNMGRRRVEGSVSELGAVDLAFTRDEVAELLQAAGQPHDAELLEPLMERTLGWPAAVRLALRGGMEELLTGSAETLSEYLEAEIWRPLDERQRQFVLATSVLEELQPSWCDKLVSEDGSAKLLRELRLSESWLLPPRKVGEGFRHHPLVREFLLSRLDEEPGGRRRFELLAARVLKDNHRTVEAVSHALEAEEWELAIECLRRGADRAFREGHADLLRDHLAKFPGEYRDRPELLRIEGYLHWAAGELEVAEVKARTALQVADKDLKADALILRAAVRYSQGNFAGEQASLQEAIDLLPGDRFISGKAWYGLGSLHYRAGRIAEAESALLQAAALSHEGEPVHVAVVNMLALLPLARGTPRNAVPGLVRAIEGNRRLGNRRGEAHASYHLAMALNQAGMHQQALNALTEAERISEELGLAHLAALIAREAADSHRDMGTGEARDRYRQAIATLKTLNASAGLLHAYHGLAVLHRRLGDLAAAARAADEALVHQSSGDPAFVSLVRLHRALVAEGRLVSQELLEQALGQRHLYYRVLAHLYAVAARPEAARQLARSALELIEDEGLEHLLREEAELISPWLTTESAQSRQRSSGALPRPFRLYLLGGLAVEGHDGEKLRVRPLALRLLAYLALRRGATVDPEQLIDALWPDRGQEMRPTMQTLIWLLRRTLHERVIVSRASGYTFDPDGLVWSDAEEFARALDQSRLEEAAGLYRGELLPGVEWADLERRHLENRYLRALEDLAEARYEQGRLAEASELLEAIVQVDPYAEETYRKLIDWHQRAGHEDAARRFRRELAVRLERELGLSAD